MATASDVKKELKRYANPEKAKLLQGFFKTGKGEYGEGDIFLGVMMPQQRAVAKKFSDISLIEVLKLLKSKIHEHRMTAVVILAERSKKGTDQERKKIYDCYLKNTKYINNWDLIDVTTPHVIGRYLLDKPRKVLYKLAKSKSLWERRISIIATSMFISKGDFKDTIKISEILLNDEHDLIHKAVGWMLREVGKRDQAVEERFLKKYYKKMPRTMLRYAIERFDDKKRKFYMGK